MEAQGKNTTKAIFAERIEKLMDLRGATQEKVAEALGVSQSSISNYRKGRIPNGVILSKLARYLGVTVEELTGQEDFHATGSPPPSNLDQRVAHQLERIRESDPAAHRAIKLLIDRIEALANSTMDLAGAGTLKAAREMVLGSAVGSGSAAPSGSKPKRTGVVEKG